MVAVGTFGALGTRANLIETMESHKLLTVMAFIYPTCSMGLEYLPTWLRFMVNGGKYVSPIRRIWVWVEISLMLVSIQVFNQERRQVWQNIFFLWWIFSDTPWKINMEPKNHLFEKENHLPNLHYYVPC